MDEDREMLEVDAHLSEGGLKPQEPVDPTRLYKFPRQLDCSFAYFN